MSPFKKRQQGSALLTALFIMTLVAIVATAMSTKLQGDIYRTQVLIQHDKLYFASQGVTFWAMSELSDAKKRFTKTNNKGAVAQYPSKLATLYPSVTLSGELYDMQAQYNLNNLENRKAILGFINLLAHVIPELNPPQRVQLALAINDWVSPYNLGVGKDSYSTYYLQQNPPYHPSHQLMSSASELRLIKDVTPKLYLMLQPYVTALPEYTPLNINTASKDTLMSLSNLMDKSKTNELIKARGEEGFTSFEKISELLKAFNIAQEQVTLDSTYFLSVAHATNEHFNLTVYTLLKRTKDKKGNVSVTILRESFNDF